MRLRFMLSSVGRPMVRARYFRTERPTQFVTRSTCLPRSVRRGGLHAAGIESQLISLAQCLRTGSSGTLQGQDTRPWRDSGGVHPRAIIAERRQQPMLGLAPLLPGRRSKGPFAKPRSLQRTSRPGLYRTQAVSGSPQNREGPPVFCIRSTVAAASMVPPLWRLHAVYFSL